MMIYSLNEDSEPAHFIGRMWQIGHNGMIGARSHAG
jgi:hypothetical protein